MLRGRGVTAMTVLALLVPVAFVVRERLANGALGFPLDDAWIPLNYARTLREHGVFAYFPGAPRSAGATAPLFTLLEAVGLWITSNEKLLAIVLGLAGQLAFLLVFARWALALLGDARWAALAVALVGLDGRVALLAVSGMETSLFMALTTLAIERRLAGRAVQAGLALGAALWVRPDAAILALVLAIDAWLGATRPSAPEPARGRRRAAPAAPAAAVGPAGGARAMFFAFAAVALAYVAFNLACGGRLLPATFAAKTAYYGARPRLAFLTGDIAECFGSGAWRLLAVFALVPLVREAAALARGRSGAFRVASGWALGLPLAYLVLLPYSHRFTRYLVPALAPLAMLATAGVREVASLPRFTRGIRSAAVGALLLGAVVLHGALLLDSEGFYRYACAYTAERNEAAGRWLGAHTPPSAIVGTHDVGAIAWYSHRPIVDAAGLVSREVTPWIGKPFYTDSLAALFDRRGVTHLAVLEDWLRVDGVPPLVEFNRDPEVMRIYPWVSGRTRLHPAGAPPR